MEKNKKIVDVPLKSDVVHRISIENPSFYFYCFWKTKSKNYNENVMHYIRFSVHTTKS